MAHEIRIAAIVWVDGVRHEFSMDSDGIEARGSNVLNTGSATADAVAEEMQRAVWTGDGELRVEP